jgi:hypothetical protein
MMKLPATDVAEDHSVAQRDDRARRRRIDAVLPHGSLAQLARRPQSDKGPSIKHCG